MEGKDPEYIWTVRLELLIYYNVRETCILTPRRAIASFNNCTTSSFTTPSQLNPFVHRTNKPFVSPNCLSGNEKVKPSGRRSLYTSCSCQIK